ncbi:hypothetical protein [Jeotgalibacillus haloalkalitolerans]|uniref:Uncharacterized protein n=1 Tax=Jeotgalibacillus haloalkalitolerans TaxID=3104292 RepID=A0ABU5KP14_9BACL|nr:hypothetical protein [Jeotgalibacillus sp. HH7-29]MDZ5712706.1 hypothetical protein [Jeotgalibacillus sp. HH7-29]
MSSKNEKKHTKLSYSALTIGIICFFIVFIPPTRIVHIGSGAGDILTYLLTLAGLILSIIGLVKNTEKNIIPAISFMLSLSFVIYWIVFLILLFTLQLDPAP